MSTADGFLFVTQLAMGFALAACVGLRAFLPLLLGGIAARWGYVTLGPSFEWMASTPALVVFGSAVAFEVLADKVPVLDHALHAVEAFVKPAAATLLAASLFTNLDPVLAMTLGLIGGGAIAGAVHAVKGTTRVASTLATGGLANPFLSVADDILATGGSLLAFLAPIVAAVIVLAAIAAVAFLFSRGRRRRSREAPAP
jgi:hypothetical protein